MNNPFAYLMFMALLRNGGFGFGGDGAGAATQGIETQAQLNAIRTQLQDNQNADCIKSAIQGHGFALSQLAQTLNIDFNTLQKCCCDVQAAIQQVAGQVGFSAERVINQLGMTQGLIKIVCGKSNCYAINSSLSIPDKVTTGDVTYAANMAYADFYPDPLKDEAACLRYAHKVANDPDGYDGMIFCRWTADAIGKAIKLDWEKFV